MTPHLPVLEPPPRSVFVQDLQIALEGALTAGDWDTARGLVTALAASAPHDAGVLSTIGAVHEVAEQWQDALRLLAFAVAYNPDHAAAWSNIAMICARGVPLEDPQLVALIAAVQAARANPRSVQPAWTAASILWALGDQRAAERWLSDVERRLRDHATDASNRGPYPEFNRAFMHLALGTFDEKHYPVGFAAYERRLEVSSHQLHERARRRPPANVARWTHGPAPQRLAVFAEQGLGDTIMCLRYVIDLVARGHEVTLEPQAALFDVLVERLARAVAGLPGRLHLLPFDAPLPHDVDGYCWAMSLPGRMWEGPDALRFAGQFLHRHWRRQRPLVAFCWQGSRSHRSDRVRSCPPDTFRPVAEAVRAMGLSPIALCHGEPVPDFLHEAPRNLTSLADTAAVLDECAAVVSIDSALVHLAGSMGVPTIACLSAYPDWRWRMRGDPLPWYASVRLARQPVIGDWDAVARHAVDLLPSLLSPTPSDTDIP